MNFALWWYFNLSPHRVMEGREPYLDCVVEGDLQRHFLSAKSRYIDQSNIWANLTRTSAPRSPEKNWWFFRKGILPQNAPQKIKLGNHSNLPSNMPGICWWSYFSTSKGGGVTSSSSSKAKDDPKKITWGGWISSSWKLWSLQLHPSSLWF